MNSSAIYMVLSRAGEYYLARSLKCKMIHMGRLKRFTQRKYIIKIELKIPKPYSGLSDFALKIYQAPLNRLP